MTELGRILTLDFETWDPSLLKYGSGSVFKYHYPECEFEVICVGLRLHTGEERCIFFDDFERGWGDLLNVLRDHDTIICHNSAYDIAILRYLYRDGLDLSKFILIDTVILAKLLDQHIEEKTKSVRPYSLDTLTKFYRLESTKHTETLTDYAWETGLYQAEVKKLTGVNKRKRPTEKVLSAFCYKDLRIFPPYVIKGYCMEDIAATWKLFLRLDEGLQLTLEEYIKYSKLLLICIECKFTGTPVSLTKARQLIVDFSLIADEAKQAIIGEIVDKLGMDYLDININSPRQLSEVMVKLDYQLNKTDKGNYSLTSTWLEEQPVNDVLCNTIIRYRKAHKMTKDFLKKIIDYQEIIPLKYRNSEVGMMYPTLKPLGATKTGRFSSGGGTGSKELSIHQIPRRDEEFGRPIREVFIPFEGETIICGDFNGQESRLQVHYASLLNCEGVQPIIDAWHADPEMKYHKKVAEFTGLEYEDAKMINLALSYDMHNRKLCIKLGLDYQEGMKIINQYHKMLPFMSQLQSITSSVLATNGYIRTIGSRKLYIDPSYLYNGRVVTKERKALSKLIQGSAADQCIEAMIRAYDSGLKLLFTVHDELVISSPDPKRDLPVLKDCMENAYQLRVPVIADCNIGDSWGSAK